MRTHESQSPRRLQWNYTPRIYRAYNSSHLDILPQLAHLSSVERLVMRAVATVLPFRTNEYVVEELIDWQAIPDDPIYQLVFPQPDMLAIEDRNRIASLLQQHAPIAEITRAAHSIRMQLNPHPAGQQDLNVPLLRGQVLQGIQHKYPETVLFFPSHGQTCHAYCTYCFRWPQFVGEPDLKIASNEAELLCDYLLEHTEVTDVLITGGDPLIMTTHHLERYIEPLLRPELEALQTIRIGTKAGAYWPYRFVTDKDADALLHLFERVTQAGKHLALMAHYSHPRELEQPIAQEAVRRIRETGAIIRCQAPLVRHVNDSAEVWAELWRAEVHLGMVPYYMFVERDTGPKHYFDVSLARAYTIFQDAHRQVSGLARTVRGPSMSATPGKVVVDGIAEVAGEKVFILHFIQARNPDWVGRPFFARFDPDATWLSELRPAFEAPTFFFEEEMARFAQRHEAQLSLVESEHFQEKSTLNSSW